MSEIIQRIHTSKKPIAELGRIETAGTDWKPVGLWYAAGDAWREWCKCEMPEWSGAFHYEVDVSATRLLKLESREQVREFNRRHRFGPLGSKLNWPGVQLEYDGIEFIPYFYDLRFERDLIWYYLVDVPSGCVWNVDKIRLKLLEEAKP